MSKRTLTIGVGHASVSKSWANSALIVEVADKKAVIQIRDPWELRYLRMQLDLIEEGWKNDMAALSSN